MVWWSLAVSFLSRFCHNYLPHPQKKDWGEILSRFFLGPSQGEKKISLTGDLLPILRPCSFMIRK
jgi:hypothetical protein